MELQVWSRSDRSVTMILVLRDHEVHLLKVVPDLLTLNQNIQKTFDAILEGQDPTKLGAKSVETLDLRTLGKAVVRPNDQSLILHGEGEGAKKLIYVIRNPGAGAIVQAILDQSGRTYESKKEEVSALKALFEPVFWGACGACFFGFLYVTASKIAAGEEVGGKAQNPLAEQLLIWLAGTLGVNGSLAIGTALVVFMIAWAAKRIVYRPEQTVWVPVG